MTTLADRIRAEAPYQGPSKAEKALWDKAIEAAIRVVETAQPTSSQCLTQPVSRSSRNHQGEE